MSGDKETDLVEARRLFVEHVDALLAHGYSADGVARWWERSRSQLGGVSPSALLGDAFDPDGEAGHQVAALAATLTGPGDCT